MLVLTLGTAWFPSQVPDSLEAPRGLDVLLCTQHTTHAHHSRAMRAAGSCGAHVCSAAAAAAPPPLAAARRSA